MERLQNINVRDSGQDIWERSNLLSKAEMSQRQEEMSFHDLGYEVESGSIN